MLLELLPLLFSYMFDVIFEKLNEKWQTQENGYIVMSQCNRRKLINFVKLFYLINIFGYSH